MGMRRIQLGIAPLFERVRVKRRQLDVVAVDSSLTVQAKAHGMSTMVTTASFGSESEDGAAVVVSEFTPS